jgi:hypothetical protein
MCLLLITGIVEVNVLLLRNLLLQVISSLLSSFFLTLELMKAQVLMSHFLGLACPVSPHGPAAYSGSGLPIVLGYQLHVQLQVAHSTSPEQAGG